MCPDLHDITASQEDYLEAILELGGASAPVRTGQIAERLGVRRATVSATLRLLAARGLVEHRAYGRTWLTARGRARAVAVRRRHRSLREFFAEVLGLPLAHADAAACAMEHAAPRALAPRLRALTRWLRGLPDRWRWTAPTGSGARRP
ncbi:MAG: MarR family transcriptional regulator [Kiritimatiellae bacterium]|nr:MarR family transcriptional regulator [Kiritimatiellia bacterium]